MPENTTDCIEWDRAKAGKGYGRTSIDGKMVYVHRYVFFETWGYLPPVVRHGCHNPACYNIDHLFAGNDEDNARDRIRRANNSTKKVTHNRRYHMERPERKEVSEKAMKILKKKRAAGRPPKGLGDGYDVHFNMRISQGHMDMIDAMIGKREMSRAECMRTLIKENYLRLDQAGMIKREG